MEMGTWVSTALSPGLCLSFLPVHHVSLVEGYEFMQAEPQHVLPSC